jgi:hypothetical protein
MSGKPAASTDREKFPSLKEDIGEDPARWLDRRLVERGPSHTDATLQRAVLARINGIGDVATARAWIGVERRLDRGPREPVISRLEDRIERLKEIGDREERLANADIPPREERTLERTAEEYESMATDTKPGQSTYWFGSPTERLADKARREGRTEDALKDDADDVQEESADDVDGKKGDLSEDDQEVLEEIWNDADDQLDAATREVATDGGDQA